MVFGILICLLPVIIKTQIVDETNEVTYPDDGINEIPADTKHWRLVKKEFSSRGKRDGIYEIVPWPKGIVPYYVPTKYVKDSKSGGEDFFARPLKTIKRAMRFISENVTCGIKFVPYDEDEHGTYRVTVGFHEKGCQGVLPQQGILARLLFVSKECLKETAPGFYGNIVRELLVILGLVPDHFRPDRDKYIDVREDVLATPQAFKLFKKSLFPSTSLKGDLDKGEYFDYDYDSILHPKAYDFTIDDRPSLVPKKPGVTVGQRDHLSDIDKEKLNYWYPCKKKVVQK